MTRAARIDARPALALAALLCLAAPSQGADPPGEAPDEFRNGDENGFGSVAMEPYLPAGGSSVPVQARFVLHDLEALRRAADVLFAFNLKGDSARVTLEGLETADGRTLAPVETMAVEGGRQPQAHFAPADLLAVAEGGRIDLVLNGRVEAEANGQSHLGAMAIAFDEAWGTLQANGGPAQVYGFTMVMATGVGGGGMPFQGQGNTWVVLPVALAAFAVAVAGGLALRVVMVQPAAAASPAASPVAPSVAVFGGPPSRPAPPRAPSAPPASPAPPAAQSSPPVPVFGGPESPTTPSRAAPLAPVPAARPTAAASALPAGRSAGGALPVSPVPAARSALAQGALPPRRPMGRPAATLVSKPAPRRPAAAAAPPPASATVRGRPPARPVAAGASAGRPVHTATRRPKAKAASPPSRRAVPAAARGARRTASR